MRLFNFCVCLWRLQLRRATRINIDSHVAEHGEWYHTPYPYFLIKSLSKRAPAASSHLFLMVL